MKSNDFVLDAGMQIATYTVLAASKGARRIVAVELERACLGMGLRYVCALLKAREAHGMKPLSVNIE